MTKLGITGGLGFLLLWASWAIVTNYKIVPLFEQCRALGGHPVRSSPVDVICLRSEFLVEAFEADKRK